MTIIINKDYKQQENYERVSAKYVGVCRMLNALDQCTSITFRFENDLTAEIRSSEPEFTALIEKQREQLEEQKLALENELEIYNPAVPVTTEEPEIHDSQWLDPRIIE